MSGPTPPTQRPVQLALAHIAEASHCQAGAVIALGGALAAALAQATANGSLAAGASSGDAEAAAKMQQHMAQARLRFLAIADEDALAITQFVALRERGDALTGYSLLCEGPREMADLALVAAHDMQAYRRHVSERTRDDLEFALVAMAATAKAAALLLDSNLRIWPLPDLLAAFDAHVARLMAEIERLEPVDRIRP